MEQFHPLFKRYHYIRQAVYSRTSPDYAREGGRPLAWDSFQGFRHYIETELGLPKPGQMLLRHRPELGWVPGNLFWGTRGQQRRQHRGRCLNLTYAGRTQVLRDWCDELNLNYATAYSRHRRRPDDAAYILRLA